METTSAVSDRPDGKILVFPEKNVDGELDRDKLEHYLGEVKNRLNIVHACGGKEENILFKDAFLLAMVVQHLYNKTLEEEKPTATSTEL